MHILVSNDDGCRAPGLSALANAMQTLGNITVVAPDRNRSGASNSLTLDAPLRLHQDGENRYCVNGTPTDCVHVAVTGLMDEEPDMVVSGINAGPNLGDDVLYSGTVAAAMEGRFLGLPAIAVSCACEEPTEYETAAQVTAVLVKRLQSDPLPPDTILNVNVPNVPWKDLQGWEATRCGHRHKAEPVIQDKDPRGRPIYWIGGIGGEHDAGPGTDFDAIRRGCVSISPLQIDLTRHSALDQLKGWVQSL